MTYKLHFDGCLEVESDDEKSAIDQLFEMLKGISHEDVGHYCIEDEHGYWLEDCY